MLAKMVLVMLVSCLLTSLLLDGGWQAWPALAGALAVLEFVRRVLGR